MKYIVLIAAAIFLQGSLFSQSVDDALNDIYHERFETASEKLSQLVQKQPGDTEAWYWFIQVFLEKDSLEKAKRHLKSAPADVLSSPIVKVAQGQIQLIEGNKTEAMENFESAIKKTKGKNPFVLHAVARAQLKAKPGDAAYGIELINKALKRDKNNPGLYVTKGDLYRKLGNGSESYKAYQDALEKDKQHVAALYKIGKIFISQNNKEMYLKYFKQAVDLDSLYAPALYDLYYYHYFVDVNAAQKYLNQYIIASDKSPQHDYMVTDLLFASKKYEAAIGKAHELIRSNGAAEEPRLLKLVAYSYKELQVPDSALTYMKQYFTTQSDSGFVLKDYEAMGEIYDSLPGFNDSASAYYQKALAMETDTTKALDYYKKIAALYHNEGDFSNEALWLEKYYTKNPSPRNIDLFNWGIASYKAEDYVTADSVFRMYEVNYPEQTFGYYWAARTNTAIDSTMEEGLAVPHYEKLVEVAEMDTTNPTNRKHLIEAYGYLAAYEANIDKDAGNSILYFEKLLELDPANEDAKKYIEILRKSVASQQSAADK